jgi:hypothetical protein
MIFFSVVFAITIRLTGWTLGAAVLLALGTVALAEDEPAAATAQPEEPRKTRLQGECFLSRSKKVPGVTVVATPQGDPSRVYLTATDRRGFFKIDGMVEGDYRVLLRRQGFRPVTKRNVLLKYPFRAVVEVQLDPIDVAIPIVLEEAPAEDEAAAGSAAAERGSLQARVVDRDGDPISEIDVRISPVEGNSDPRFLRSDENGVFATEDLVPGRWHLRARALGYLPMRAEFEVAGPVEMLMVVVPQPSEYEPSPLDLMPAEEPIPPPVLTRN